MSKKMLVNAAQEGEVRVAIIEDQILEDLSIAVDGTEMQRGNIYKGTVVTVETGLQAAFVDYGEGRNGFITFNDIHPRYYNVKSDNKRGRLKIQDAVKPGAELLVQVHKEAVGNKGAALTTDITMPGRFLVYTPLSSTTGVSRKIEDEKSRKRLKEIVGAFDVPDDGGVIVRTAGQNETSSVLGEDFQQLLRLWGHIRARFDTSDKPTIVHREPDVIIRTIRDYLKLDVEELIVDDPTVHDRLTQYFTQDAPDIVDRLKLYRGKMPIFSNYGLEKQLAHISSHKVPLPSGGSIVINPTEALTAVDENSGKSRGQENQEIMAYQTNLEAAEAVARQLRLRDVGGLIVVDFIDMMEMKHRRGVTKALKDAMKKDKARVEIGRISKFGLLELSRQRIKARLLMSSHNVCPHCEGSGYLMTTEFQSMSTLRRLQELSVSAPRNSKIIGRLPVPIAVHLLNEHRSSIGTLEEKFKVEIRLIPDPEAMGTRDAFEVKIGNEEKVQPDRNRRDRKGRERKQRQTNTRKNKDHVQSAEEAETPKTTETDTHAATDEQPKRQQRRNRKGKTSVPSQTTQSTSTPLEPDQVTTSSAETTESDDNASARRAAARERIRARRAQRGGNTDLAKSPEPKTEESTARKGKSKEERLKAATRRAAQRVRGLGDAKNKAEITTEKRGSVTSDDQGATASTETTAQAPRESRRDNRTENKAKNASKNKPAPQSTKKPMNLRSKLKTKLANQSSEATPPKKEAPAETTETVTKPSAESPALQVRRHA